MNFNKFRPIVDHHAPLPTTTVKISSIGDLPTADAAAAAATADDQWKFDSWVFSTAGEAAIFDSHTTGFPFCLQNAWVS
jgi:hypothetical protein